MASPPPSDYNLSFRCSFARVAELADAQDLGSCGETRGGSSPPSRTNSLQQGSREKGSVSPRRYAKSDMPDSAAFTKGGSRQQLGPCQELGACGYMLGSSSYFGGGILDGGDN